MPQLSTNRTLPVAITRLRLGSALQGCGAVAVSVAFDQSSAKKLFIYDDRALGYTDWVETVPNFVSKCLSANNPKGALVALLPLDGRIVTGTATVVGGICDCMLVTDKEASFVEFKTNVTSENFQTVIQRATEACEQLWHTYDGIVKPRCAAKGIDLSKVVGVDFYVVFDKDLEITSAQSQLMDLQNEFLNDKQFPLFIGNEKTWE